MESGDLNFPEVFYSMWKEGHMVVSDEPRCKFHQGPGQKLMEALQLLKSDDSVGTKGYIIYHFELNF
jgi:hypothetical protein